MSDRYGYDDVDHKSEDWIGGPPFEPSGLPAGRYAPVYALPGQPASQASPLERDLTDYLRCAQALGIHHHDVTPEQFQAWRASQTSKDAPREGLDDMHREIEETRPPLYGASVRRLSATRDALALALNDEGISITRAGDIADRLVKRLQEPLP